MTLFKQERRWQIVEIARAAASEFRLDVDAFHRFPSGDRLLSFDTPVELPGAIFALRGMW